jgi:hypothetical protein
MFAAILPEKSVLPARNAVTELGNRLRRIVAREDLRGADRGFWLGR